MRDAPSPPPTDRPTGLRALGPTTIGLALFALFAWPLLVVELPPYQDVPGHTAAVHILRHLATFPDFKATTFFKTNALYFDLGVAFSALPIKVYAKGFVALILFLNGQAIPRFVERFAGREAMLRNVPLYAPFVHHWFVSMGMLNYCIALPLSLFLMLAIFPKGAEIPKKPNGSEPLRDVGVALLTGVTWLAHSFPLFEVAGLACLYVFFSPDAAVRKVRLRRAAVPTVVTVLLSGLSFAMQAGLPKEPGTRTDIIYDPVPDLIAHLFTRAPFGGTAFTYPGLFLAIGALVLVVASASSLAVAAPEGRFRRLWGTAIGLNLIGYFAIPAAAGSLAHIEVRIVPYLWLFLLACAPPLPRRARLAAALGLIALAIGHPLEIFRLSEDVQHLAAARPLVPQGARLLPLVFASKGRSQNTRPLNSASALYILDRDVLPHDVWTHNASMPLVRTVARPLRFDRETLSRFLDAHGSQDAFCAEATRRFGEPAEGASARCRLRFDEDWRDLWQAIDARYSHVLLVAPSADAKSRTPTNWGVRFEEHGIVLLEKRVSSDL